MRTMLANLAKFFRYLVAIDCKWRLIQEVETG